MKGPCEIEGCTNRIKNVARKLCSGHYQRLKRGAEMSTPLRRFAPGEWGKWSMNGGGYRQRERMVDGVREFQSEHRFVMSKILGRELLPSEEVHHKDGVKTNNIPGNLELWSSSQPRGQRISDKVEWALEIIRHYRPEVLA